MAVATAAVCRAELISELISVSIGREDDTAGGNAVGIMPLLLICPFNCFDEDGYC